MKDIKDDHLLRMTDSLGIFQHARFSIPDYQHGYTTDDNARALIVASYLNSGTNCDYYRELILRYLAFVNHALTENGKFKNFMDFQRNFYEEEGSEDCFGRCIWALCTVISASKTPINADKMANFILSKALPNVKNLVFIRAKAYTLLGLASLKKDEHLPIIEDLAREIIESYDYHRRPDWNWFEDEMTYSNAIIPASLFAAYASTNSKIYLEIAKKTLDFLLEITNKNGYFKTIGCNGWLIKGTKPAEFDEQPVEAGETVFACHLAFKITAEDKYLVQMIRTHEWFHGMNCHNIEMIDNDSFGCYDGITPDGINLNQGAESIISYLLSEVIISSYKTKICTNFDGKNMAKI